jgi:hypothetical protein
VQEYKRPLKLTYQYRYDSSGFRLVFHFWRGWMTTGTGTELS